MLMIRNCDHKVPHSGWMVGKPYLIRLRKVCPSYARSFRQRFLLIAARLQEE